MVHVLHHEGLAKEFIAELVCLIFINLLLSFILNNLKEMRNKGMKYQFPSPPIKLVSHVLCWYLKQTYSYVSETIYNLPTGVDFSNFNRPYKKFSKAEMKNLHSEEIQSQQKQWKPFWNFLEQNISIHHWGLLYHISKGKQFARIPTKIRY